MSDPSVIDRPQTGIPAIDEATAAAGLTGVPLSEHRDRLAQAHAVLDAALHGHDDGRHDQDLPPRP